MVLILYIMGVSSIREFALPLMVGIVAEPTPQSAWQAPCGLR